MRRGLLAVGIAFSVLVICCLVACKVGIQDVSILEAFADPGSDAAKILWTMRLPRVAFAALAGGGLAVVGVAFQAVLRNPLAEPYVLGVSGGAALGATLAIAVNTALVNLWLGRSLAATLASQGLMVPGFALLGGLAATTLVVAIARAGFEVSGPSILLAGVIINSVAGALITLIQTLVSATTAQQLLFWLIGNLDAPATMPTLVLVALAVLVLTGISVLMLDAGSMNLLSLGSDQAHYLGVSVRSLERRVYVASSLIVGAIVSVTGMIGFVGLVTPHAIRRLLGPDHRVLMPVSFFAGATMLVACDLVSRVLFRFLGRELAVGVVTALVGGPLFLMLLLRKKRPS